MNTRIIRIGLAFAALIICAACGAAVAEGGLDASGNIINSWMDGSGSFAQLDFTITNASETAIDDWELRASLPRSCEFIQGWSGVFLIDNGELRVKAVDYNTSIPAHGSITLGCIVRASEDIALNNVRISHGGVSPTPASDDELIEFTEYGKDDIPTVTPTLDPTPTPTPTPIPTPAPTYVPGADTPFARHGQLSISGAKVIDERGAAFTLRGISTHGIAWFPQYVNEAAFKTLRDDWNVNTIRLAMYSDPGSGYSRSNWSLVKTGVKTASKLGMYVIIDWHVLSEGNPNKYASEAKAFFGEMSAEFSVYGNVLYEICNEPNGDVQWQRDIKPYAEEIIPVIRANDPDGIIIVGTPTWSQDVDIAAKSPITDERNIAYALHFYAATHTQSLRSKLSAAINAGLPILVTEFGMCDSSGNGANDFTQAKLWLDMLEKNSVGYMCWNLSNKSETCALIASGCNKTADWSESELSESGRWYREYIRSK